MTNYVLHLKQSGISPSLAHCTNGEKYIDNSLSLSLLKIVFTLFLLNDIVLIHVFKPLLLYPLQVGYFFNHVLTNSVITYKRKQVCRRMLKKTLLFRKAFIRRIIDGLVVIVGHDVGGH